MKHSLKPSKTQKGKSDRITETLKMSFHISIENIWKKVPRKHQKLEVWGALTAERHFYVTFVLINGRFLKNVTSLSVIVAMYGFLLIAQMFYIVANGLNMYFFNVIFNVSGWNEALLFRDFLHCIKKQKIQKLQL